MQQKNKIRTYALSGLLAGLLIPFILQTDLYPFFRFGMFAEPLRYEVQTEHFVVMAVDHTYGRLPLEPLQIGIHQSTFDYLMRNYYYRGEWELFLKKLYTIWPEKLPADELEMHHIVGKDTVWTGKLKRPAISEGAD